MKDESTGLFHCGRCGAFFRAEPGAAALRRCTECGGDPALGIGDRRTPRVTLGEDIAHDVPVNPQAGGTAEPAPESRAPKRREKGERNPTVRRLVMFLVAWFVVLGVFAAAMTALNRRRERDQEKRAATYKATRNSGDDPLAMNLDPTTREFLGKAYPQCGQALFGFLQSSSPETRAQWIARPVELIGALTRQEETAPTYAADEMPKNAFLGILETPDGTLIESLWNAPDGRRIEAVFAREGDTWKLDWESFVRHSDTPWVMFLAGAGPSEQEFRLFVRERLADERKNWPTLSVVFHAPRFGAPDSVGPASPEFIVKRLSPRGRALDALFRLAREGKVPFDARVPTQDPSDMIRVRVRVRRIDEGIGRKFELVDVLAGHWLGIEADGIPEQVSDEPGGSAGGLFD